MLYLLWFKNGKGYIGITASTPKRRRIVHLHHARKGRPGDLQAAIRKYGEKSFETRTLMISDNWKYLCEMEQRAIRAFGTRSPEGYNLTDGGEGAEGRVYTDEQRARLSIAVKAALAAKKARNANIAS